MAKVSITKIAPKKEISAITAVINEQNVIIQQYLPIVKKAEMVGDVLNAIIDADGVRSAVREEIYFYVYLVKYYTNLNITETMLNNANTTYDLLIINKVLDEIIKNIPQVEYDAIYKLVHDSIKFVADYRVSALGVLTELQNGAIADTKTADEVMEQLTSLKDDGFLGAVLTKMG